MDEKHMTFNEFHEWGTRKLADALILGGFKGMSDAFFNILQRVAQNGPFEGSALKDKIHNYSPRR